MMEAYFLSLSISQPLLLPISLPTSYILFPELFRFSHMTYSYYFHAFTFIFPPALNILLSTSKLHSSFKDQLKCCFFIKPSACAMESAYLSFIPGLLYQLLENLWPDSQLLCASIASSVKWG